MKAIVYTSNTGFTEKYARLLSEKTGLATYALKDAAKLDKGDSVIYLGWISANRINGLNKAMKRFDVRAVGAVGMLGTGSRLTETREANKLASDMPLFTLQGGYDNTKLKGIKKLLMKAVEKTLAESLSAKAERTPDEEAMLDMVTNGGDYVRVENLAALLDWYEQNDR